MASMGVSRLTSTAASLSRTDLCFWTKSVSASGSFVLFLARCEPAASFWNVVSSSAKISFERSRIGFGMPANFAT